MKIQYDTETLEMDATEASNLLLLAIKKRLPISHSCEGMASCGTCRVIITDGVDSLPERNHLEKEMANDRNFESKERLACQLDLAKITAPFSFRLPEDE